jgi:ABC-2 type transport system permease protein
MVKAVNMKVLLAVFKRNVVSYFASPLGYVFICVFVWLSVAGGFLPNEFFNSNLANLDQLNRWFPFIMLVFIPAITMSIWADERRQGTDELLLTIPAGDLDIVAGKYLAAVAIYTVSLLFSLVCTFAVLRILGRPDVGLFLGTYVGYWLIGLAMLAIGIVASFVTANLTVAFILGAIFNVPLVFAVYADAASGRDTAMAIKQWSIGEQFRDFGRGILSLSGLSYFLMIVVVMLYLSMVFIGRRHWVRGKDWCVMATHFVVRVLALAIIAAGLTVFFNHHDLRKDVTSEKLSSLSSETVGLLDNLQTPRVVKVEAFISPSVPESYVQTRLNLISILDELEALGGDAVTVRINSTERFTEDAARAEKRFGIAPRQVTTSTRGTLTEDHLFMGVALSCGLQKVTLPFIDRGTPVEYELVRAIMAVTQQKRKRVGVLQTDAKLYGGFNMQTMASSNNWPIIDDLQRAYDVVQVDATGPITEKYDVLLAVQPSSLGLEQMNNFIAAVRSGQPTAIFEDPFPVFAGNVPATSAPRRQPGMNPMMMMGGGQQQNLPKGDIRQLWSLLGVDFTADDIVCQQYNPFPKLSRLPDEFVFVDRACGAKEPFNDQDPISSRLQHLLFPFPGAVSKLNSSALEFTPLVRTSEKTGIVHYRDMLEFSPFGPGGLNPDRRRIPQGVSQVIAAQIRGKVPASQPMADEGAPPKQEKGFAFPGLKAEMGKPQAAKAEGGTINVVVVADIDMLHQEFFRLREQGDIPEAGIRFDFDNVTFVMNVLDYLAGDQRFIEIRKRRPQHRTLERIDQVTEGARKAAADERKQEEDKFDKVIDEEQKNLDKRVKDIEEKLKKEEINTLDVAQRVGIALKEGQQRIEAGKERLKRDRDQKINEVETSLAVAIRKVQDQYKMWAFFLPPIPPLLVAIGVFFTRRAREREGVARSRLRS